MKPIGSLQKSSPPTTSAASIDLLDSIDNTPPTLRVMPASFVTSRPRNDTAGTPSVSNIRMTSQGKKSTTIFPSDIIVENSTSVVSIPSAIKNAENVGKAEFAIILGEDFFSDSDISELKNVMVEEGITAHFFVDERDAPLTRGKIRHEYPRKVADNAVILLVGHGMPQSKDLSSEKEPLRLDIFRSKKSPPYIGNKSFDFLGETNASQVIVYACLAGRGVHKENKWGGKPVILNGRHDELINISIAKEMIASYLKDCSQRKRDKLPPRTFEETLAWWAIHATHTITGHQPGKRPCISEAAKSLPDIIGTGLQKKLAALSDMVSEENPMLAQALNAEAAKIPSEGFNDAIIESRALSACISAIGDSETVKKILEKFPNIICSRTTNGNTLLACACFHGRQDIVGLLLDKIKQREDAFRIINENDKCGNTALLIASKNGHHYIVEKLLKLNDFFPLNEKDGQVARALQFACRYGHTKVVKCFLYKIQQSENSLCLINEKDKHGNTPLMIAVQEGREDIVSLLLEFNEFCFINEKNKEGHTALMFACALGHKDIVDLLLKSGARITDSSEDGSNVLMLACTNGRFEIVKLLLEQNELFDLRLTFDERNNDRKTALALAEKNGHQEIAAILKATFLNLTFSNFSPLFSSKYYFDRHTPKEIHQHALSCLLKDDNQSQQELCEALKHLTVLDLSTLGKVRPDKFDTALRKIADALEKPPNNTLRSLSLAGCNLQNDEIGAYIAPILSKISSIDLSGCRSISIGNMKAIISALKLSATLQSLNLANCGIDAKWTKEIIQTLQDNRTLIILNLERNNVEENDRARLMSKLAKNKANKVQTQSACIIS
jgi:ankyrin repeat protein